MNQPQVALDTPPPAEVGEPEPDALDKRIAEEFPGTSEEVRAKIRARALKRHDKSLAHEAKKTSIDDRIKEASTIEMLNLLRVAILRGLQLGTLNPSQKALDRWNFSVWNRVVQLILETKRPGDASYIWNFVRPWPCDPILRQTIEQTFNLHCAHLPNAAQWLLLQGIEIEGITKLP